ncbi:MAG TPA: hypothetical protein VMN36_01010 [Verrucomicrobiales bacterium]|nr:hypothetical protein [Verrucomicrobiales bacterium]
MKPKLLTYCTLGVLAAVAGLTLDYSLNAQNQPAQDPFVKPRGGAAADPDRDGKPGEAAPEEIVDILVQAELIRLPQTAVTDLLVKQDIDPRDGDALRAAVDSLLNAGEAEILETAVVRTASRQRTRIESITERISPTEFHPPEDMSPFHSGGPSSDPPRDSPGVAGLRPAVPLMVNGKAYWPPVAVPCPVAFEVRSLGMTLEVDPVYTPETDMVEINLAPELGHYAGQDTIAQCSIDDGPATTVSVPAISVSRVTVVSRAKAGAVQFLGITQDRIQDRVDAAEGEFDSCIATFARTWALKEQPPKSTGPEPGNPLVSVVIEFIDVPHVFLTDLFRQPDLQFDSTALRLELDPLIEEGVAKIHGTAAAVGASGSPLRSEGSGELIYPTEYDPGEVPRYWIPAGTNAVRHWSPSTYPTPTAFESRILGITSEALPTVLRGGRVATVDLRPEIVRYVGDNILQSLITPDGIVPLVEAPAFSTFGLRTQVRLPKDGCALIGAAVPMNENGERLRDRMMMVFVTARF